MTMPGKDREEKQGANEYLVPSCDNCMENQAAVTAVADISHIAFRNEKITDDTMAHIIGFINTEKPLSVDLSHTGITKESIMALAEGLKNNNTLRCLNLRGNNLGGVGAAYLVSLLRTNKTIISFDIMANAIPPEYMRILAHYIAKNNLIFLKENRYISAIPTGCFNMAYTLYCALGKDKCVQALKNMASYSFVDGAYLKLAGKNDSAPSSVTEMTSQASSTQNSQSDFEMSPFDTAMLISGTAKFFRPGTALSASSPTSASRASGMGICVHQAAEKNQP